MAKQEFSIVKLMEQIPTEADAYKFLEDLRWGGAPEACPKCGGVGRNHFLQPRDGSTGRKTRTGANTQRRVWFCGHCRKQFSVLTNTIFHGTKISIRTWVFVLFEVAASKNSVSAWEISRKYSITNESAWHMIHRIREAMKMQPVAGLLGGAVQVDETWIGGNPKNRHANDPREIARKPRAKGTSGSPYGVSDKQGAKEFIREYRETIAFARLGEGGSKGAADSDTDDESDDDGYVDVPDERKERERRKRSGGVKGNTLTIPVPVIGGSPVTIEGEFPITEAAWSQFMAVLGAMKPGLVSTDDRGPADDRDDRDA